jgi:predicted nucleotidyltransferase
MQKCGPSIAVRNNIDKIRAVIARYHVENARIFGSTSRGDDVEGSDVDLLVDATEVTTLLDLARLKLELEELLGVGVDIATPCALPDDLARNVADDLRPISSLTPIDDVLHEVAGSAVSGTSTG